MIWLYLAADIVVSSPSCPKPDLCHYHPQYWQALTPGADGQLMVLDHGRWRWHSLKELGERD